MMTPPYLQLISLVTISVSPSPGLDWMHKSWLDSPGLISQGSSGWDSASPKSEIDSRLTQRWVNGVNIPLSKGLSPVGVEQGVINPLCTPDIWPSRASIETDPFEGELPLPSSSVMTTPPDSYRPGHGNMLRRGKLSLPSREQKWENWMIEGWETDQEITEKVDEESNKSASSN